MRASRARLPAHGCRQQVLQVVAGNDVVVISGATGCGKSTQVGRQCRQQQQQQEQLITLQNLTHYA
jgi:HrpA-like RNA helicase